MTWPRWRMLAAGVSVAVVVAIVAAAVVAFRWHRAGRATANDLTVAIAALEKERSALITRRDALVSHDRRMAGMPDTPIKVGVPTSLANALVTRVLTGFTDQVAIDLKNLRVTKSGTIKKVVTLGTYGLTINVERVRARLKPGAPVVTFGGNAVKVAVPVTVASGSGRASIRFIWDGRAVAGAVCGDMDVTREVKGLVVPDTYQLTGSLELNTTDTRLMVVPRIPPKKIHVQIKASDESWAAAQKILDDKTGVCGFVLDHVDVMGAVRTAIDRGFDVTLPLNRIKPMAFPVGVTPEIDVRGRKVALKVKVGKLTVTEHMMWLGVDVTMRPWLEAQAPS